MKVSFCYFDTTNSTKIPNNLLPDEELLMNSTTDLVVVGERSSFKRAVFEIEGQFESVDYCVKAESAVDATPVNYRRIRITVCKLIAGIAAIWMISVIGSAVLNLFGYPPSKQVAEEL
jgi:hypothetical protein